MTPDQVVAIMGGLAALLAAVTALLVQVGRLRSEVNGRLQQLVDASVEAAQKRGELLGRDYVHAKQAEPRTAVPLQRPADGS